MYILYNYTKYVSPHTKKNPAWMYLRANVNHDCYPTCKTNYGRNLRTVNTRRFLNVQMCVRFAKKEKFVKRFVFTEKKTGVSRWKQITLCAGRTGRRVVYGQLGKNNTIDCTQMSTGQRKIMVLYFGSLSTERIDNTDKHIVITRISGCPEMYPPKPYEIHVYSFIVEICTENNLQRIKNKYLG